MNLTTHECALIIASTIARSAAEDDKKITRFQMSLQSLLKISCRKLVDNLYLDSLCSEFAELGWAMFQLDNTRYAFIRISSVESWRKISSRRMEDAVNEFKSVKNDIALAESESSRYHNLLIKLTSLLPMEDENE
ncbi:MAG: hypothetical protein HGB32_07895 [Geobacteraceae bacterium]|nr:hypothetical protein [Geobacteraceae bacterium]